MFFKNHLAKKFEPLLEHLENKLEQEGQWQKAQELRYQQYEWRRYHPKLKKQTSNYLARVYNHRLQIQREAYLQVEHDNLFQKLEKDPSLADILVTEIECFQKRLKDVDRDIWMAERDVESAIRAFPEGPFKRALCARRQKNNSYLAKHLQTVCAAAAADVNVTTVNGRRQCVVIARGNKQDDVPNIIKAFQTCNKSATVVFPEGQTYWIGQKLNPVLEDNTATINCSKSHPCFDFYFTNMTTLKGSCTNVKTGTFHGLCGC
ncbi:hypothetical protein BDV41DRAFT_572113 [Aspergillus transmontanensis]|uniref:Uncharacterized protein n=1 Tax=Aspergillus transmontanensis TaxID=1034304 RepID=A0A5N6WB81_9EURO|nr:hypothetical protein BDV41DRAFT_572113 [Aspergillus transmontanensis]